MNAYETTTEIHSLSEAELSCVSGGATALAAALRGRLDMWDQMTAEALLANGCEVTGLACPSVFEGAGPNHNGTPW
jgi:hypothetical protein